MIQMRVAKHPLINIQGDTYVFFVDSASSITQEQRQWMEQVGISYDVWTKKNKFSADCASLLPLYGIRDGVLCTVLVVGLGNLDTSSVSLLESLRQAIGSVIRYLEKVVPGVVVLDLPFPEMFGIDAFELAQEVASISMMSAYQFNEYITDSKRHLDQEYDFLLVAKEADHEAIKFGWERGVWEGFAVNQARRWCDMPPCALTPSAMAESFSDIAQAHPNLHCQIFDKQKIQELGMGGLLAVSQGSVQEPRFVVVEYLPEESAHQTIGLVGKGVTFDSGGISIKPSQSMDEMKDDMAGAASVLATMQAIAHLKPHVRVVAAVPLTENMPSGSATKPGDIIYHYNGKTSEIKNTDAEGRLILADALGYICKEYQLDALIDIATLTGACAYALGSFYAGLMTENTTLRVRLEHAGAVSGDKVWALPFSGEYDKAVTSDVADVCNIGKEGYRAGAVTAGKFLSQFVPDALVWAHIDIAGVSFKVPDKTYIRSTGATGFGVRLFVELLMSWKQL